MFCPFCASSLRYSGGTVYECSACHRVWKWIVEAMGFAYLTKRI